MNRYHSLKSYHSFGYHRYQSYHSFGLCRDDGLAVIKSLHGPEIGRLKKNVLKTMKDCRLNITIEANLHTVSYLDITFYLRKDTYLPYRKPDNSPA